MSHCCNPLGDTSMYSSNCKVFDRSHNTDHSQRACTIRASNCQKFIKHIKTPIRRINKTHQKTPSKKHQKTRRPLQHELRIQAVQVQKHRDKHHDIVDKWSFSENTTWIYVNEMYVMYTVYQWNLNGFRESNKHLAIQKKSSPIKIDSMCCWRMTRCTSKTA